MTISTQYLYDNSSFVAEGRLRGLEAIEDSSTIRLLSDIGIKPDWTCLEIGAGAGSIAGWLAARCRRTVATDLDTRLLDPTAYEVWQHDVLKDAFPETAFDLIHFRHVLIHIDCSQHARVLNSLFRALKPGGVLLAEESDLETWKVAIGVPDPIGSQFSAGIATILDVYRSRKMNPALGRDLEHLIKGADFALADTARRSRIVKGGTAEAHFQKTSARQLAESVRTLNSKQAIILDQFADCFDEVDLEYESRSTVSVWAKRSELL